MWNKFIKEVRLGRVAGPFEEGQIPYTNFVQSPIGLVPKAGGKTRLIFHLSYKFKNGNLSVNDGTPDHLCSVKYNDIDHVVANCSKWKGWSVYWAKTDVSSAFRVEPILPIHRCLLIMKAINPQTGQYQYFIDKTLPFGHCISCSKFQRLSNAVRHIVEVMADSPNSISNYLDDFLFQNATKHGCEAMVELFLNVCGEIGLPISMDKTVRATRRITFLGLLLDGKNLTMSLPEDKRCKALSMVRKFSVSKKATVREIQSLAGTLNFINKAIHPGRPFTRRMYAKYSEVATRQSNSKLKPHHHVRLDAEFRNDCRIWDLFLQNQSAVCRPFIDIKDKEHTWTAKQLKFYTDASKNQFLGIGMMFNKEWSFAQ